MSSRIARLVVVSAVLVAALAIAGRLIDSKYQEWSERAEQSLAFAEQESARADSLERESLVWRERADSIAAEADSRSPIIRERIRLVRDTVQVPDTCAVFVAQRDSIIDELVVEADQWREAYEAEQSAADRLRDATLALRVANDSLRTVLEDRPLPRPAFMPSIEAGPFVGLCADGRPCAGVGIGLTFKVKLPWP